MDSCVTCHVSESNFGVNPYGKDFKGSFTAIENIDSDGDGFTNIEEILADTFPGDASSTPAVNSPPTANAAGPYNGKVDEPLNFDGSGSSDNDGTLDTYEWDFGDGSTGSGAMPTHTYMVDGTYNVTLTVIDDMGANDSAGTTATIRLDNQAPIADANNPYNGTVDEPVQFDGSDSYDPDGTIVAYDWDFGDGSIGSGATPTHTYTVDGIYNVTLTVTDDMGANDSDTTSATIGIDDDDEPPSGEIQEKLQAIREDLMAAVKDGEFSRRVRWMFWRSTKNLSNAAGYLERGKIEDASEKVEEAIRKIKRAARMERRNSELKVMCEEFIQDLEKLKAEIKAEVNNHDEEGLDHDHDDDDDRHHTDDDDDDDYDDEDDD